MGIPRPVGGKVVVITGAARGIGAGLAEALSARGARVALVGLEPELLAKVAQRCGPNAAWWECDVTDQAALDDVVAKVKEHFHRIDVVVANAGIAVGSTLLLGEPTSYDRVVEVNLLGSIRTARAFLPALIASNGHYLQIASLAAMAPAPMMGAYCASKAGVEAFAQVLRSEVAHHGVTVGITYLSWTESDMTLGVTVPEMEQMRAQLPGPFGKLSDLPSALQRIVAGIERRSPRVYGQGFIKYVPPIRWLIPSVIYAGGKGDVARVERAIAEAGVQATLPVGAGGRADVEARRGTSRR